MESLIPAYTHGTHRLAPPEETFARITPYLQSCGITRCAEVTALDVDLGVPTYCAIRPAALVLQTTNGKGLTSISARVSALMEAIELHHAEQPAPPLLAARQCQCTITAGEQGYPAAAAPHGYRAFLLG